jgi:hypothetical protein
LASEGASTRELRASREELVKGEPLRLKAGGRVAHWVGEELPEAEEGG